MREQLFRSEKLAATGQLISGVASDLRAPLDNIVRLAESLAASAGGPAPEAELQRLSAEAHRASEIVWRLVSFARQDQSAPQRVDLNGLVAGLTRFREPEWRVLGLRHQSQLSPEPAEVAGVESQIEQVCLNLLVYAEQRAADSPGKTIAVKTGVLAGRALVEIDYSPPHGADAEPDPFAEAASANGAPTLEVCLGILRNHGGDARLRRRSGLCGFEIELPLISAPAEPVPFAWPNRHPAQAAVDADAGGSRQVRATRIGDFDWVEGASGGALHRRGRRGYRAAPALRRRAVGGTRGPRRLDRVSRPVPGLGPGVRADRGQLRSRNWRKAWDSAEGFCCRARCRTKSSPRFCAKSPPGRRRINAPRAASARTAESRRCDNTPLPPAYRRGLSLRTSCRQPSPSRATSRTNRPPAGTPSIENVSNPVNPSDSRFCPSRNSSGSTPMPTRFER